MDLTVNTHSAKGMLMFDVSTELHLSYDELLAAEIEREQLEARAYREALEAFAPFAALMWRYTDGDGAMVIDDLRQAVFSLTGGPPRWLVTERAKKQKRVLAKQLRSTVFERDAYRCQHCGTWKNLSIDHIVPEAHGGSDDIANLQTLCVPCNTKKGTR